MHAVTVTEYGATPAVAEVLTPQPESGQVLIKLRAAGMNPNSLIDPKGGRMGLLDRAKTVAEQATIKAKEGLDEVQTRRELGQAYDDLGKTTYELALAGEITHPRLAAGVERITTLTAQLEDKPN